MFVCASPSVDKVVTVKESLKTWVDFLTACVQRGLGNVKQSNSCALRSPSEMDAPSEMFFFLFDTIPGCLLDYLNRLTDVIG